MKKWIAVLSCCSLLAMSSGTSFAEEVQFPRNEPINYLIPFSAGGESDLFARMQQPYLEKMLGQKVVVNYKIGADGALAWSELVNSPATGHNLAGINLPHIIVQPLQRKNAGYKTQQLKPVMIFHVTPCVLAVRADSPYKTLEELITAAKEKPGSVIIGACGNGTSGHLASVMLNRETGLNIPYIPFPGTSDLPIALLGGHVTAIMAFTSGYSQYANEMRVLAIASEERDPHIDAPTFKELGYDIVEGSFRGIAVPPSTPDAVVEKLYQACAAINAEPEFSRKAGEMGMTLLDMNPKQSEEFIAGKIEEYKVLLTDNNK